MNGNCHFIYGAAVGTALAANADKIATVLPAVTNTPETATLFILGGLIGGIFPDIDNPSSHMGQLAAPVSTIIGAINKKLGKVGSNHRGILHDPITYLIGLVLCYFFFPPMIGFFIGCLSHLFLDMFNAKGIPFFFIKRIRLAKIESGSAASIVLTWLCIVFVIAIALIFKYLV